MSTSKQTKTQRLEEVSIEGYFALKASEIATSAHQNQPEPEFALGISPEEIHIFLFYLPISSRKIHISFTDLGEWGRQIYKWRREIHKFLPPPSQPKACQAKRREG